MDIYFDDKYAGSGVVFDTTRKAAAVARSLRSNPVPGVTVKAPMAHNVDAHQTEGWLREIHTDAYVDAVGTGQPQALAESNLFDWDRGIYPMAVAHASGMVAATSDALFKRRTTGTLSSGFHHARPGAGEGYCTFNGLAVAVAVNSYRWTFEHGRAPRIVVLDFDAHYGGGTYQCVKSYPNVTLIDVSTSQFDRYIPTERRHHVRLSNAAKYLDTITYAVEVAVAKEPDVVLYNAGMDPTDNGVAPVVLLHREERVADHMARHNIPVAWCLAGGYTNGSRTMGDLVGLHRHTVEAFAAEGATTKPPGHMC